MKRGFKPVLQYTILSLRHKQKDKTERGADEETPGELYSQEVNSNQEFNTNTNLNKTIKKKVYCRFYMLSQFLNMNPKVFNTHQEI